MKKERNKFALASGFFAALALVSLLFVSLAPNVLKAQFAGPCPTNQYNIGTIAPWYCSQINQAVYSNWIAYYPIIFLVMMASFMIAILIFMLGIVLGNRRVRDFGVGELYEALATTVIVAFFMLISAAMLGVIPAVITGPIDPYNTSLIYINRTINVTETTITTAFQINVLFSYYSSITVSIGLPESFGDLVTDLVNAANAGEALLTEVYFVAPATALGDLLSEGLLLLHAEFYLILFSMYAAIPVFLIPGIAFRAFFPTRAIGGMFIGIAIAFYFIMPILFSVAFYFTNKSFISQLAIQDAKLAHEGYGPQGLQNGASPTSPLVLTLAKIQSTMAGFWLSVLFYPALIIGMSYFCVIVIADFIGGATHSTRNILKL